MLLEDVGLCLAECDAISSVPMVASVRIAIRQMDGVVPVPIGKTLNPMRINMIIMQLRVKNQIAIVRSRGTQIGGLKEISGPRALWVRGSMWVAMWVVTRYLP